MHEAHLSTGEQLLADIPVWNPDRTGYSHYLVVERDHVGEGRACEYFVRNISETGFETSSHSWLTFSDALTSALSNAGHGVFQAKSDERIWTDEQIRAAVMAHRRGCAAGKSDFLDELGIDPVPADWDGIYDLTITVQVRVDRSLIDRDHLTDDDGDPHTIEAWLRERFIEQNLEDAICGVSLTQYYEVEAERVDG